MGFLDDDDPFENIVREFFGGNSPRVTRRQREYIEGEQEDRIIDFVETKDSIFIVFELPGYSEEDIVVDIDKKTIQITSKKKNLANLQDYLMRNLSRQNQIIKPLPERVDSKTAKTTFRNGVLEISFKKK